MTVLEPRHLHGHGVWDICYRSRLNSCDAFPIGEQVIAPTSEPKDNTDHRDDEKSFGWDMLPQLTDDQDHCHDDHQPEQLPGVIHWKVHVSPPTLAVWR